MKIRCLLMGHAFASHTDLQRAGGEVFQVASRRCCRCGATEKILWIEHIPCGDEPCFKTDAAAKRCT